MVLSTSVDPRLPISEASFYAPYGWCLNPLLTLGQIHRRMREEVERYGALDCEWQRRESLINLHLFACGLASEVADYLAWRPWTFATLARERRGIAHAIQLTLPLLNLPRALQLRSIDRPVAAWARRWRACVDRVSGALIEALPPTGDAWIRLRGDIQEALSSRALPERVLARRMRIPEGYRDQDMTHQDAVTLVRKFLAAHPPLVPETAICVIGARTAGAYLAPVAAAYLARRGARAVEWFSLRPKEQLSSAERTYLRALGERGARVFLIDDHPNTGATFAHLCQHLERAGVELSRVHVLAPGHPVRPGWELPAQMRDGVTITRLEPDEFHKARLLAPTAVESVLRDWLAQTEQQEVRIRPSAAVDAINDRLEAARRSSFQVHMKRLYEVEIRSPRVDGASDEVLVRRILAKSVGWGWLAYHAWIAGTRLAEFVAPVIGLRNGLLFTEWLDVDAREMPMPEQSVDGRWSTPASTMPDGLPGYVAARARRLRLDEDPCFRDRRGARESGTRMAIDELADFLAGAYGSVLLARVNARALRRKLHRYASPLPTLVDGQMGPAEWVRTRDGFRKVDFEHYNFVRATLKTADPAYDLAAAVFEFRLSHEDEGRLLDAYGAATEDADVERRVDVYKLLYAEHAMRIAAGRTAWRLTRAELEALNQRYAFGRDFLIEHLHRLSAAFVPEVIPDRSACRDDRSCRLFLLDLDGVFDHPTLGSRSAPHTTASGPLALALLATAGFVVVPATGRCVAGVSAFCRTFGLRYGIAEHGCALVDAHTGEETSLLDAADALQLDNCRVRVQQLDGVFIDPAYRYSLRAYRFRGGRTIPLAARDLDACLGEGQCDRLTHLTGADETYFLPRRCNKATGLAALRHRLPVARWVAAIGDASPDLVLLSTADLGYAPANCSSQIRAAAARDTRVRIMSRPYAPGLLAAVRDLLVRADQGSDPLLARARALDASVTRSDALGKAVAHPEQAVIAEMLAMAERSLAWRALASLCWRDW